ncbi:MAG TPA: efflux RND transporter periplasmic adaptor subunit [Caulobacteraceae bacterium]|nr:efflux RND transporter periplasmic adaptor subunit [Caulobacteraceae bacterium]
MVAVAEHVRRLAPRVGWRTLALAGGVLALLLAALVAYWLLGRAPPPRYATQAVSRGDVETTVTASGSVNPVVTVQVGTYVSGPITAISCDYNTRVRSGQLCAKIDPQPYALAVQQAEANLADARAQFVKDRAAADYAVAAHRRQDLLWSEQSTSRDAADAARAASDQAKATIAVDQAVIQQRLAALRSAQVNLNYTNIVSPVDGTVVSRNVNVGQTVAASFSTPTLFLIAKDLTKMQVDTSVSESDIAGIVPGAPATFTVDAYPRRVFQGVVAQARIAPVSVQNVITYDVVIAVANQDLALKPGMTATANVVKAAAHNVLRVPSQALRFTPPGRPSCKAAGPDGHAVWVRRNRQLTCIPVKVGLDNDSYAEIAPGGLREGDRVITAQAANGAGAPARPGRGPSLRF